jgi:nucleoid DNA-binding protein
MKNGYSRNREKASTSFTAEGHGLQQRRAVVETLEVVVGKGGWLVTKKDMAKAIAEEMGLTQGQARAIIQRVFDGITETLLHEGRLELRNFGVFEVKKRRPRQARNPRTGAKGAVPEKLVATFKPGRVMEERVGQLKKLPHGRP